MSKSNFERMIDLAVETFAAHNDPNQLDVDEEIIQKLQQLHPASLSEYADDDGPVIWVLLIPTTEENMFQFINRTIGENELLNNTIPGADYSAIYLCSALALPEYRNKGLTKKLAMDAISSIRESHNIKTLIVWNFTNEGAALAKSIASELNLPLLERQQ